ncbi:MAG TPA: DUF2782 domain-containing protein [Rhodocyclaceae bacterium]|jgi:hypothetical protein|nr:DUF2782 domain-containing protein [Rhodocyclaceae bacterium]
MRRLLPALLVVAACRVFAADSAPPPGSQPLPEAPPPPPGVIDAPDEPQVTIKKKGEDKVEEYRVNGRLYMIKVTPPSGIPYYLVDDQGNGVWTRRDPADSGMHVPMWVIKSF